MTIRQTTARRRRRSGELRELGRVGRDRGSFRSDSTFYDKVSSWFIRAFDSELNAVFAAFMSIWGSLFYQIWKRNNSVLAFSWDCEDIQEVERESLSFPLP